MIEMVRIFKTPITHIFVKTVSFIMPLNINYRRTEILIQNKLKNGDWTTSDILSKIGMANWISMFSSVSKLLSEMEISLTSFSSEYRPATLESESLSTTTVVLQWHF